ncbi:hypothetical protein LCGC14_0341440 [marine sediment metagenome]|uniref:Uncharacterized protein n=1 Tax=marine sediment metagenome TaxID=412755 RepID=A0A0F9TWQ6_9ZZZZ
MNKVTEEKILNNLNEQNKALRDYEENMHSQSKFKLFAFLLLLLAFGIFIKALLVG